LGSNIPLNGILLLFLARGLLGESPFFFVNDLVLNKVFIINKLNRYIFFLFFPVVGDRNAFKQGTGSSVYESTLAKNQFSESELTPQDQKNGKPPS
jgi:hypothetical protein